MDFSDVDVLTTLDAKPDGMQLNFNVVLRLRPTPTRYKFYQKYCIFKLYRVRVGRNLMFGTGIGIQDPCSEFLKKCVYTGTF